jgi:hypothetical protein
MDHVYCASVILERFITREAKMVGGGDGNAKNALFRASVGRRGKYCISSIFVKHSVN